MYSIGKDSSVLLHLARKAFHPGGFPTVVANVNTGKYLLEPLRLQKLDSVTLAILRSKRISC
jgi:sulfate adenylyltransferase subunit 2